ncbi:MAG: 50S ribosomal protein L10 [Patescibacteria group bacterium]
MPLTKAKKLSVVSDVKDRASRSQIVIFTNFHGLGMERMTELRAKLRGVGAEYLVVKKRLLKIGLGEQDISEATLNGEVGVVFGFQEPTTAAKVIHEFAKVNAEQLSLLGGLFESRLMNAGEVKALATIPSREVLYAQLASVLAGPIRGLALVMAAVPRGFVQSLAQIAEKKS